MDYFSRIRRKLKGDPSRNAEERRRFDRFKIGAPVKIYHGDDTYTGQISDISPVSMMINASCFVKLEDAVVIEHEAAGRINGVVIRVVPDGFAVRYDLTASGVQFALASLLTRGT